MNAKVRMPKLWGDMKFQGTFKELFLTFIGTTLSIILTFGTSAWIEQREAEQARKMLAMTIIHDIDEGLTVIKNRALIEERGCNITNYLLNNIDRLESISEDTLFIFFNYVSTTGFNTAEEFKMSNENIFNSSQDSWRTLNDRKFLYNVQEFYNARRILEQQTREWVYFQKPVTKAEEYQIFMENTEKNDHEAFVAICRRLLQSPRVRNYVLYSYKRLNLYKDLLVFNDANEENKFLMNITEKDMEEFINQTYMTVRHVQEEQLVGTWEVMMLNDKARITYEYRADHSFSTRQFNSYTHPTFQGDFGLCISMNGTWAVEGDSLVKYFDLATLKVEVDDSGVTYSPEQAEEMEAGKAALKAELMKTELVTRLQKNNRVAHATNIDETGTRMELCEGNNAPTHFQKKE